MKLFTASLMILMSGTLAAGQPVPAKPVKVPSIKGVRPASGTSISVAGIITLRPQGTEQVVRSGAVFFDDEDLRVSATAYLYTMLKSMERSAQLLGQPDAAHFAARAAVVKAAFNARFLDRDTGYYRGSGDRGYRQTHNVLAVAFGLTPDAQTEQRVVDPDWLTGAYFDIDTSPAQSEQ